MAVSENIKKIIEKVEHENKFYTNRYALDSLAFPLQVHGREKQTEQLVRILLGCKSGSTVPFVSVYGKSGSGKSTIVKHVCNEIPETETIFVNLRQVDTVFSAANLILSELGQEQIQRIRGLAPAILSISDGIKTKLESSGKKFCVLVLDEFDVILDDKRGKPSNFVFKLIEIVKILNKQGMTLVVIGIANNALSEYDLDDRVKSRIGSAEVYFEPYDDLTVFEILKGRSAQAFTDPVDDDVLHYCSDLASKEHGDVRKALDLLKTAAEIAASEGNSLTRMHVDKALEKIANDRVSNILSSYTPHFKRLCAAFARLVYLSDEPWYPSWTIYEQYRKLRLDNLEPLGNRRVSSMLKELEDIGLAESRESHKGQHGYGKLYKLAISPEVIGKTFGAWWDDIVRAKQMHQDILEHSVDLTNCSGKKLQRLQEKQAKENHDKRWQEYVGVS